MTMEKNVIRKDSSAEMMTFSTITALALALLCPTAAHADVADQASAQASVSDTPAAAPAPRPILLAQYASPNYGPPPPGYGAPPPPPPGYYPPPRRYGYGRPVVYQAPVYQHDGFYLHMTIGAGYTSLTANTAGDKATISGGGLALGIAAGGAIAPNLILFGTLYDNMISDPDISYNGVPNGQQFGTDVHLIGLGIGLAYYLMPVNVYFSAAVSATWMRLDDNYYDETYLETDTGLGFQGQVGKEWWVWPGWGMGVAAQLTLASMKSADFQDTRWTGASFSILFSATYN